MRRAQFYAASFVLLSLCASCAGREPVKDLPVADAPSLHGKSATVFFRDGTPRVDLLGTSAGEVPYQIVPLVAEGWTPEQPVTVWVLCKNGPKAGSCEDPSLWLESLAAQPLPLRDTKVIGHGDAKKAGTGWALSVADAEKRHGLRSDPKALFITVEEPPTWTPSRPPPVPPDADVPPGVVVMILLVVLASLGAIAGNMVALIRYEADRKKHGAHGSRRVLAAWALSIGCATVWPTVLVVGPVAAILGLLELKAVRQGKAPAASRIPAIAAVANGLGMFLLIAGCGAFALIWAYNN